MNIAIDEARKTMNKGKGGPFGALITDKDGKIIATSSNLVLESHDPTAHADTGSQNPCYKGNGSVLSCLTPLIK